MKQIITLSHGATLSLGASAQLVELRDTLDTVVNGSHIVHYGSVQDPMDLKHSIRTTLLGGTEGRNINVRRYELNVQDGTENYFCWNVCYAASPAGERPVWTGHRGIVLTPNEVNYAFGAYHRPEGIVGSNTYRYVWFDADTPNDTAWVDIEFVVLAGGVGVNEVKAPQLSVYPNPSLGGDVNFVVEHIETSKATVTLYSLVGERLESFRPQAVGGRLMVAAKGLPAGMYFAVLENNGVAVSTQRLLIQR